MARDAGAGNGCADSRQRRHDRQDVQIRPCRLIRAERVDDWWDVAAPLLKKAIDRSRGETSLRAEYERLREGRAILFLAEVGGEVAAAAIARIHDFPNKRALIFYSLGGHSMEVWLQLEPEMIAWAKSHDCAELQLEGRRGWARVFTDWEEVQIVMRKDIRDA